MHGNTEVKFLYIVPVARPSTYKMGTWSFPLIKRPKRRADHPSAPNAAAKERVELHFYSPQITVRALSFTFDNTQRPALNQTPSVWQYN